MKVRALNAARRLFAHYAEYHRHGPRMLGYLGLLGFIGFPSFYLLRFTKADVPYDDLAVRVVAMLLCAGLLLRERWPLRLKPLFLPYSYVAIIFALPTTFIFTSLKNGGGPIAVGNTMMAIFFVILLTDWRNMIAMLLIGLSTAVGLYVVTDPQPQVPLDYVARLPMFLLVVVAGSFFKLAAERATAEKVRQAYSSLAGSIAHEMRNPLGQLRHSLERISNALPAPNARAQAQVLDAQAIDALYTNLAHGEIAVQRGLQVISMTLDEVSAKPLDASTFVHLSAAQVCAKAVQEYAFDGVGQRERVGLHVERDFTFRGDETACLFVLFNLLKNALYYMPSHPRTRVDITVNAPVIMVRDTGPGIAADALGRLFEAFGTSGKRGGTGLGLAYCRRVMTAFGGRVECDSVVDQYTCFTLNFPVVDASERELHSQAVLARARSVFVRRRLLVVDDDAAMRRATCQKLSALGATVDEAADGLVALAMLTSARYDLVVLDLNMPEMDGYALADALRSGQAPINRDVCIVAYTSEPAHLAQIKTQKAGINGFINKPCEQVPLLQALCSAMEQPLSHGRPAQAGLAGRRILLVDDNSYGRKAVAAHLQQAGVEVAQADCGQAALDHVGNDLQGWDVIVLDVEMPGLSGMDVARAIRLGDSASRATPILALSAHSGVDVQEQARDAGMDDFLTKPVSADALYARLRKLLGAEQVDEASTNRAPASMRGPADGVPGDLLDRERLAGYRRIGMLDELVGGFVPQLGELVGRLETSVDRRDFQASLDIMHSLVGMSGEAGAAALHRVVRGFYGPMVEEHRWPAQPGWVEQVRALTERTRIAIAEVSSEE